MPPPISRSPRSLLHQKKIWAGLIKPEPEPLHPFEASQEKPSASEDLNWLNNLGRTSEPAGPRHASAPQEDLNWLNHLGGDSEPLPVPPFGEPSSPRQTAPLGQNDEKRKSRTGLRARERPLMPAPGDLSMDWFARIDLPAERNRPLPHLRRLRFQEPVLHSR